MARAVARVHEANEAAAGQIRRLTSQLPDLAREPSPNRSSDEGWSASDIGHTVPDAFGLIPLVGEPADLANAIWYTAEGDYVNAGLSAAALVPIAGWAATGGKLGVKSVKAVRSLDGGPGARGWTTTSLAAPAPGCWAPRPRTRGLVSSRRPRWHGSSQRCAATSSMPPRAQAHECFPCRGRSGTLVR